MVVLDTDVLIDYMRRDAVAVRAVDSLLDSNEPVSVSVATRFELFHGVARSNRPEWEHRKIARALRGVVEHSLTPSLAGEAGLLDGRMTSEGRRLGIMDTIIAATAIFHREPLLTNNLQDFGGIPGLETRSLLVD